MAALTTLALWLAVRAGRLGTVRAYAWAGMASGLAASAQYTGGIAIVPVVAAWAIHERSAPDRLRKLGAIVLAASLAFVAGSPFSILDLPGFLDGFAAQFARFAVPFQHAQPAWLLYVKELSQGAAFWVPLALAGLVVLIWRRSARSRWAPVVLFALTYFYLLASHGYVSGSEAVPLLPALCLFSSVAAMELLKLLNRIPALARPVPRKALLAAVWVAILVGPIAATVRTLALLKRTDTRELAADWLKGNAPRGARLAVEPNGPTYLDSAGFKVTGTDLRLDRALDWYRPRVDYLVISAADVTGYGEYLKAGPTVFQIGPTSQRLGPPILIVKVDRP
jgi:4-amino-4-deoxy-L-arabinose transferase-like glycosyltransferase